MPATAVRSEPVPLPFKSPESVVDPVPPCDTPSVPEMKLKPTEVVATTSPFWSVARSLEVRLVKYTLPDAVNCVVDAAPLKTWSALQLFAVVVPKASVNAPVELLYWSGYAPVSDDEEILL